MTMHELQRKLLEQLAALLSKHGFSLRPKSQSFDKAIDSGRFSIHLSFIEHERDFDVTVDVAIRFDLVEDLVHRFNRLLSKKEKAQTFTMGTELGNLEGQEPLRWNVSVSNDVSSVAQAVYAQLQLSGLSYFQRYAQLDSAYEVLSQDNRESWLHSPLHVERAKRACAMLVVMGRQSELAELAEQKIAYLTSIQDPGISLFQNFVSSLIESHD